MKGLFDYLAQNPLWTAILILLIILMIVMFVLASKSGKKRQAERERILSYLTFFVLFRASVDEVHPYGENNLLYSVY